MNMTFNIKKYLILSFFLVFGSVSAPTYSVDLPAEGARDLIKFAAETVISYAKTNRTALQEDPTDLYITVNEIISPHVDFPRVARWILGKHWRKASQEQRLVFQDEFRKLLIRTYAKALLKVSDEKLIYPPLKGSVKNGKYTVRSALVLPDGRKFTVQYRMHNKDQSWKIYDISVEGVSLVSTYRSSFATEIRKVGLDGLLDNLVSKNEGFNI